MVQNMFYVTYVAEQHMFCMLLLISSDFKGQIFFSFFGGQKIGYFEGWGQVQIVLGSTHIVQ